MSGKLRNVLTQSSQAPREKKSRKRNNRNRNRNRGVSQGPDGILAGYGSSITTVFSSRATADGQVVRGYDLLPAFTFGANISFYAPANPASWNGTRIAAIASGYQSYRPLKFRIHYRPQVGSNSDVAVFIGTLWQTNYITSTDSLEPSLLTSPGGVYTPAWQSCVSNVHCGNYLPQRMFPTRDPHQTTVPFAIVARAVSGGAVSAFPGRIFVEYTYEFRNAIGSGDGFAPAKVTSVSVSSGVAVSSVGTPPAGVLVDFNNALSTNIPLGATVSWTQDISDATKFILSLNGSDAPNSTGTLYVYSNNGLPN